MKAFCPGHVTGFFAIEDGAPVPEKRGSRGAGFCVELGAVAEVKLSEETVIYFGDSETDAPVTRRGLELLAPGKNVAARIDHQLPMGQGFGMSAAGTFAACLAAAVELKIPDPKYAALRATHIAEVENRTGLGDAVAQSVGGFVHRLEPGIPPHGEVGRLNFPREEVVLCVLGEPLHTSDVLGSIEARTRIRDSGNICQRDFEELPGFQEFLDISWFFARDTGLATEKIVRAMGDMGATGRGSMAMLGNSLFAFGFADSIEKKLAEHGKVIRTAVSLVGAHLTEP